VHNSLIQTVVALTAPGVPDLYNGAELWDLSMVDPDNRRPVDWDWRQAMLRRLMGGTPVVAENRKLFLILRLLGLRARRPETFLAGGYEPLEAGPETCAFLRADDVFVVVALRPQIGEGDLAAPGGRWRDVLRGEERSFASSEPLGRLLGDRGVAVYERLSDATG
jgi:(1->4)-alpha-D-glucan 1-alpha-D-glucosylmutase